MGHLFPDLLIQAYSLGYFPMPDPQTGEIVFLRPDPRAILPLDGFHCSRSLRKTLRKSPFQVSFDQCFDEVMKGCADREETWITEDFFEGYQLLFEHGHAHSIEVWEGETLVGGIYGVTVGSAFFAESKFHRATDASKLALFYLIGHLESLGFQMLEVQFLTPHLAMLGVIEVDDPQYQYLLREALKTDRTFKPMQKFKPDPRENGPSKLKAEIGVPPTK